MVEGMLLAVLACSSHGGEHKFRGTSSDISFKWKGNVQRVFVMGYFMQSASLPITQKGIISQDDIASLTL